MTAKAAELPVAYRKGPAPETVASLKVGDLRHVALNAIEIDSEWGVWIDPNALTERIQSMEFPLVVQQTAEGYSIDLRYAVNKFKTVWEASPTNQSFEGAGFLPVAKVS